MLCLGKGYYYVARLGAITQIALALPQPRTGTSKQADGG